MGKPLNRTDCDDLGRYIHQRNQIGSRNLLEALQANHGTPSNDNAPPHVNLEPDWYHSMWFGDLIIEGPRREGQPPTISFIQAVVAKSFKVTRVDMLSERRTHNVVLPRQVAMYLAKTLTLRSYPEIGRRTGGRDHTTVIHAFQKISARCVSDPEFAGMINALKAEIRA
jgi:hypothetical protein